MLTADMENTIKDVPLAPNWVRLAPNGTILGLSRIDFSTFWLGEPKCTETDLKKSHICRVWGQSDPISGLYRHPWMVSNLDTIANRVC